MIHSANRDQTVPAYQSDFEVLTLDLTESICAISELQIPSHRDEAKIESSSRVYKSESSKVQDTPVSEPVRLLRPRANPASPSPPPRRYAKTIWRGLVLKALRSRIH